MSSAGASGADFNPESGSIHFNDLHYVKDGVLADPTLEEKVREIMKTPEYKITINLMVGIGQAIYYTCDLTQDYIAENVDYMS
jgi:glutamate N-acetyltransferase/amino-acid N-acetyltransferase